MRTLTLVRKDLKDTCRTKTTWLVAFLLLFLGSLMAYIFSANPYPSETLQFKHVFLDIIQIMSVIMPIVAIVATYLAIAGERERGSIKFMLSLPNTRRQVFVGKFASRSITVGFSVLGTFVVSAIILGFRKGFLPFNVGSFPVSFVLGTTAIAVVYALTFVTVSLALSAAVSTRSRAIAGAFGSYFVLVVLYVFPLTSVPDVVRWVHHDVLGLSINQDLYHFVEYTSPLYALQKGLNLVVPASLESYPFKADRIGRNRLQMAGAEKKRALLEGVDLPTYLQDEFALVIFAFWIVVPLVIGYWRFRQAELG